MTAYDEGNVPILNFQSPAQAIYYPNGLYTYAMGNTTKRSITEQIGTNKEQHLDLLFLGCGDLRNVLCTVSELSQRPPHHCPKSIDIHLNDYDPTILPRNAIILDIIGHINPDIPDDMDFLWNVWYNMTLSKSHGDRLRQVITSLINNDQNDGNGITLRFQDSRTEQECLNVWKDWLELNLDVETVKEERRRFIERKMSIRGRCSDVLLKTAMPCLNSSLLNESNPLYSEIEHWFMEGTTTTAQTNTSVVNPTLIRPFTHEWKVHYGSCPFEGHCPLNSPLESQLQTSSILWCSMCKNIQEYYDRCIGIHTNLLPTVLGLHLAVDFDMGNRKLPDNVSNEELLYWVKAETVRTPLTLTSKENDIITALWKLTERCFHLIKHLFVGQVFGESLSSPLTLLRIIHQMGPLIQGGAARILDLLETKLPSGFHRDHGFMWRMVKSVAKQDGGSVVEVQVNRLQLSVTEMFKDETPIPKILLSGGFNSCPVISNSIRFNVKEGTVTFHMLESDWKSIEPESLCNIVEYKTGIPVFCCGPFLLFDDKIRLKYVDPLATFGLHAVQTFCIENDTASSSALLEMTKIEEENSWYTVELAILDADKCNTKDMTIDFTPESRPIEIDIYFLSSIGCKIRLSCPVVSHSSKFQLSKKQKRIFCHIPKKEHWVTGEMVLRIPAQVPFYAMDKWDTKSDDIISICGAMFRSEHDMKLKSLRATGPPFYALRESIAIILQEKLKDQSSQFVYSVEDDDHRQSLIMQPRDILSKIGLIIKIKEPIYKWNSIPYAKCIFYDCKQHTDIININPVKADKMALEFWKEAHNTRQAHGDRRIPAEPEEIELFRRMLYINAARTEQEYPAVSVFKNSFICPLYPRDSMPHTDAMMNLLDLPLIHKNLPEATNVGGNFPMDQSKSITTDLHPSLDLCCAFCKNPSKDLKKCTGCKKVFYCNRECQKQHWKKEHKLVCYKRQGQN
ncbi:hypothetical protein AC249_AIPGENE11864 [Exaiptasia diaphana]|nr:hypothetical protein AC249_AIPGENE11864 [Exaiptasia diaphana]